MVKRKSIALVLVLSAAASVACGGGGSKGAATPSGTPAPTGGGGCQPQGTTIQLAAQGVKYLQTCIAAPANTAFTIAFDNKDSGVRHNVEVFSDAQMTQSVFKGEIVTGPKEVDYQVGSLAAGTYHFHCDIHPSQMQGELIVT